VTKVKERHVDKENILHGVNGLLCKEACNSLWGDFSLPLLVRQMVTISPTLRQLPMSSILQGTSQANRNLTE
jgi:hypothetical protein